MFSKKITQVQIYSKKGWFSFEKKNCIASPGYFLSGIKIEICKNMVSRNNIKIQNKKPKIRINLSSKEN